jgi:hypothetical protein
MDTLEILGEGAAGRLAYWENYRSDLPGLVKFIQERIHSEKWENGATLERNKRVSLEHIVIELGADIFTAEDIKRARDTIDMARFIPEKVTRRR